MSNEKITPEELTTPDVDRDPEVLAEAKKNRIWHLRLERYTAVATAIGSILQTFKAEAVSLVSGIGTLVIGWFQIRKWVVQGRNEVREAHLVEANVASKTVTHQHAGQKAVSRQRPEQQAEVAPRRIERPTRKPTSAPPAPAAEEFAGIATTQAPEPNAFADPMTYVPAGTLVVFVWSFIISWRKRRQRQADKGGK